jgi:hypothetical protein
MKSFEDQIKALRGEFSSTSQISTDSNSYYLKKYGPEGTGGSMEFNGTFVPGKFYTCEYKTKTRVSDAHPFIDRYPLFIFLKKEKYKDTSIMISIDLNVIPPDYRGNILFKLWDQYYSLFKENSNTTYNSQLPITNILNSFKRLLEGTGWKTSLTGFKSEFISGVKVVDYEDLVRIPYLSDFRIEGQSVNGIYNDYRSKLNV